MRNDRLRARGKKITKRRKNEPTFSESDSDSASLHLNAKLLDLQDLPDPTHLPHDRTRDDSHKHTNAHPKAHTQLRPPSPPQPPQPSDQDDDRYDGDHNHQHRLGRTEKPPQPSSSSSPPPPPPPSTITTTGKPVTGSKLRGGRPPSKHAHQESEDDSTEFPTETEASTDALTNESTDALTDALAISQTPAQRRQAQKEENFETEFDATVRIEQIREINDFFNKMYRSESSALSAYDRILIAYGEPGTGKTRTVAKVLSAHALRGYVIVRVHMQELSDPSVFATELLDLILVSCRQAKIKVPKTTGSTFSVGELYDEAHVTEQRIVLFLDELDLLIAENLATVISLMECHLTRTVLCGTTNDLDSVMDRLFEKRRGGARTNARTNTQLPSVRTVSFKSYSAEDMFAILETNHINIHDPTVQYGVRRIAQRKGDLRALLDLLRRLKLKEATPSDDAAFNVRVSRRNKTNVLHKPLTLDGEEEDSSESSDEDHDSALDKRMKTTQDLLGREYMTDINNFAERILALPSQSQMICACLLIMINRTQKTKGIKSSALYHNYKNLCEQMARSNAIARAEFDCVMLSLKTQAIITTSTPVTDARARSTNNTPRSQKTLTGSRTRTMTPKITSRTPRSKTPIKTCANEVAYDFCLDYHSAMALFKKLKALGVSGFTMCKLLDEYD